MQAFVCFLLSVLGEVATVFGATCLGVPDGAPLQLLWVNLVTEGRPRRRSASTRPIPMRCLDLPEIRRRRS